MEIFQSIQLQQWTKKIILARNDMDVNQHERISNLGTMHLETNSKEQLIYLNIYRRKPVLFLIVITGYKTRNHY
jgi:hypothetical protein